MSDFWLTDKEIPYKPDGDKDEIYCDIGARDKGIFLEGVKAEAKKLVEWLDQKKRDTYLAFEDPCEWVSFTLDDWQALQKEVEDG